MLNPQSGNMYAFVDFTWNPIRGQCKSHDCVYCFMKVYRLPPLKLDAKTLQDDLGSGRFIFVGSSTDMFADDVPEEWILAVLEHCRKFDGNRYLFQSKNPARMLPYLVNHQFPTDVVLGTTIETNRSTEAISKAPPPNARAEAMARISMMADTTATIEPICDCDVEELVEMIRKCSPKWVNIGADSKGHHLPEPRREKVEALIAELKKFTEVKVKNNLARLTQ